VSPPRSSSNVYVLPQPLLTPPAARPRRRSLSTRLRWLVWWWRLRLTGREVIDALRRFGRPRTGRDGASFAVDVESDAPSTPRRSAGPAQVIELAAARQRRSTR
jgi:hypothetical protein